MKYELTKNPGRYYWHLEGLFPFMVVLEIDKRCPREFVRLHTDAGGSDPYLRTNGLSFFDDEGYGLIWDTLENREFLDKYKDPYARFKFTPDITIGEAFAECYDIDDAAYIPTIFKILDEFHLREMYPPKIVTPPEIKEKLSKARKEHLRRYKV